MSSDGGGAAASPDGRQGAGRADVTHPQRVFDVLAGGDSGQESAREGVAGTDLLDHVDGERRDFDGDVPVEAE